MRYKKFRIFSHTIVKFIIDINGNEQYWVNIDELVPIFLIRKQIQFCRAKTKTAMLIAFLLFFLKSF